MAVSDVLRGRFHVPFARSDVTGAFGDSVTVLPIVVALGALTPAPLPAVLLWFGVFQIVWGLAYGLPLSVEPMKALCGLVIAGAISYGELVGAGLLAGVVLLVVGRAGWLSRVSRFVGDPVIRGIQLAVALLLARASVSLVAGDPPLAAVAAGLTLVVALAGYRRAAALVVLGFGGVLAANAAGFTAPTVPNLSLLPVAPEFTVGAGEALGAQLAMTVGNAAVATALLCRDLYDRDVSPDSLATSMGGMCLVSVPLGGLPMCHGSGGLAGKHAFGARTGGANLVLGGLYLVAAFTAPLVAAFPTAVLGALLVYVAWQLGATALDTDDRALAIGIGVLGLLTNVGLAFVLGSVGWWVRRRYVSV